MGVPVIVDCRIVPLSLIIRSLGGGGGFIGMVDKSVYPVSEEFFMGELYGRGNKNMVGYTTIYKKNYSVVVKYNTEETIYLEWG